MFVSNSGQGANGESTKVMESFGMAHASLSQDEGRRSSRSVIELGRRRPDVTRGGDRAIGLARVVSLLD